MIQPSANGGHGTNECPRALLPRSPLPALMLRLMYATSCQQSVFQPLSFTRGMIWRSPLNLDAFWQRVFRVPNWLRLNPLITCFGSKEPTRYLRQSKNLSLALNQRPRFDGCSRPSCLLISWHRRSRWRDSATASGVISCQPTIVPFDRNLTLLAAKKSTPRAMALLSHLRDRHARSNAPLPSARTCAS